MPPMNPPNDSGVADVRVDIWLWAARFFKTRNLAKQAIVGGHIDLNDGGCKPAKTLHVGDRLQIARGEERLDVEVLALSDRRGPASVAQGLYRETESSRLVREAAIATRRMTGTGAPAKRPDKQARRQLRQLKGAG